MRRKFGTKAIVISLSIDISARFYANIDKLQFFYSQKQYHNAWSRVQIAAKSLHSWPRKVFLSENGEQSLE